MSRTINNTTAWPLRMRPKDIGVALTVLLAFAAGLLLRSNAEGGTRPFHDAAGGFDMQYPSTWRSVVAGDGPLLRIENPRTDSAYKANVTVEARGLDTGSPATLQELVDRRVVEHGDLTGYHFLLNSESTIAGARVAEVEYAYVAQPIDMIRSLSLPVVVHCREYVLLSPSRVYYITLAAPESDFAQAGDQFDRMVQTAKLQ